MSLLIGEANSGEEYQSWNENLKLAEASREMDDRYTL